MPETSLKETILTSFSAQEPWPDNVKLYQPYEVEQILLPDNASCLAVQAFLKMCNLPFDVEMRWNAEFMSPSGRVPFIKCGAFVVSELEPIVQFAANKGVSLCAKLSSEEKAEMRAYMSLITNVMVNAELYISWLDEETFRSVTSSRNSSVYPWPLGWIQTRSKRNAVVKRLKALHWHQKTLDQVLADVEQCCNSLSQRLGDRDYFFGTPTALDASVYGHMRALLGWDGPKAPRLIKTITAALLRHTLRMSHHTAMKMTPQEEYIVSQAYNIARHFRSPERNRRVRMSRSSVKCEGPNKVIPPRYHQTASTPILYEPPSPALHEPPNRALPEPPHYHSDPPVSHRETNVHEIIDDILDSVFEMSALEESFKTDEEDLSFVVVQVERPSEVLVKAPEFLDTIDENVSLKATASVGPDRELDSGGFAGEETDDGDECGVVDLEEDDGLVQPFVRSSVKEICEIADASTSGKDSKSSVKSQSSKALHLTDSNNTLRNNDDEASVESLLRSLRMKTPGFYQQQPVDVD